MWFQGRNTPVVVSAGNRSQAITRARAKKRRPAGNVTVKSARVLTAGERKQDKAGTWIRTRVDGKSPGKSRYGRGRGQGPPRRRQ